MKKTLYIVGCGAKKRDAGTLVKYLYIGGLFVAASRYAERVSATEGGDWVVFSAHYGLMNPHGWISPYNLTMTEAIQRDGRAAVVSRHRLSLELRIGGHRYTRIEIHAGAIYAGVIREAAEGLGVEIVEPLQGKQIGERLHWYKQQEMNRENL